MSLCQIRLSIFRGTKIDPSAQWLVVRTWVRFLAWVPVSAWFSSRCSGFLPQSKDVQVRLIGHVKLPIVSWDVSVRGISRLNVWGLWG